MSIEQILESKELNEILSKVFENVEEIITNAVVEAIANALGK